VIKELAMGSRRAADVGGGIGPAPPSSTTGSVFVLRDADALGLALEETNGRVRIKQMSVVGVGGLMPRDGIQSPSLEVALSDLSTAATRPIKIRFLALQSGPDRPAERSGHDAKYFKKGNALCMKEKYMEAAATYALVDDDDPLLLANRCAALQLARRIDEASAEANRLIQRWPKWEMGYARKAACQVDQSDVHGAIRTLAQGLSLIPESSALLRRVQSLVPEKEQEVTCLGSDFDTMISVVKTDFFKASPTSVTKSFAPSSAYETGLRITASPFNPLLPLNSQAVEVNGVPAESTPFGTLKQRLTSDLKAVVIVWRLPQLDSRSPPPPQEKSAQPPVKTKSSTMNSVSSEQDTPMSEMDEKQIAIRLSAVPQSFDQVYVFGAGEARCNGDYYPQGTRNERPWFENEYGIVLSYEQAASGICGWVLGNPSQSRVMYVLRPGHEPRGEDFGQWLAVDPDEVMNPPPSFVGVGDRVPSLKKLTTWIREGKTRLPSSSASTTTPTPSPATPGNSAKTMVPCLLALKGHGIRLLEGGWEEESIQVFDLIIDQALALAVGDERCPVEELGRILRESRSYKEQAVARLAQSRTKKLDGEEVQFETLFEGVTVNLFEDQSRRIELSVLDSDTLCLSERALVDPAWRRSRRRRFSLFSVFGCTSVPAPSSAAARGEPVSERWARGDVNIEVGSEGVWKKLIISNTSQQRSWELSMPDETALKALHAWKGTRPSSPSLVDTVLRL